MIILKMCLVTLLVPVSIGIIFLLYYYIPNKVRGKDDKDNIK